MTPKSIIRLAFVFSALASPATSALAEYPDPARYERAIAGFEADDARTAPPEDAILCIGSSSMRGWHYRIADDLAPLTVLPRGFGGSNLNDVMHFADRVVLPYEPRAILLYEGDNDIAVGISPEAYLGVFRAFVEKVRTELPGCRIYAMSAKPSISRWHLWPKMVESNALIKAECETSELLTYIDVASPMLGENGRPLPSIFKEDKLHMNDAGYDIWAATVRPILLENELGAEAQVNNPAAL